MAARWDTTRRIACIVELLLCLTDFREFVNASQVDELFADLCVSKL